jgi:hypothetical protein
MAVCSWREGASGVLDAHASAANAPLAVAAPEAQVCAHARRELVRARLVVRLVCVPQQAVAVAQLADGDVQLQHDEALAPRVDP